MFFATDRSVLMIRGVRTSVTRRGALPNVPAGAALNALSLSHWAVGWSAEPSRSAKSPGVRESTPVTFGRRPFPSRLVLELLCETPIGNPLWKLNTADATHPPANVLP